jgi:hypothetical protein
VVRWAGLSVRLWREEFALNEGRAVEDDTYHAFRRANCRAQARTTRPLAGRCGELRSWRQRIGQMQMTMSLQGRWGPLDAESVSGIRATVPPARAALTCRVRLHGRQSIPLCRRPSSIAPTVNPAVPPPQLHRPGRQPRTLGGAG